MKRVLALFLFLAAALSVSNVQASVIAVGPGAFPASATAITFMGLADGLELNGLTVGGVLFSYSLGNGNVVIDGGPGVTNNVNPPDVVSTGNNTGILTLVLPSLETMFGYGYAILDTAAVPNATTITLFNGATNVGALSYSGSLDPIFTGGFAGIQSTVPFNSVELTFSSVAAPSFALDNVLFASVPEPSAILLMLTGGAVLFWLRRPKSFALK